MACILHNLLVGFVFMHIFYFSLPCMPCYRCEIQRKSRRMSTSCCFLVSIFLFMKFFTFRGLLSYCAQLGCDFMILHCIGFSNLMLMWCFVVMGLSICWWVCCFDSIWTSDFESVVIFRVLGLSFYFMVTD